MERKVQIWCFQYFGSDCCFIHIIRDQLADNWFRGDKQGEREGEMEEEGELGAAKVIGR